MTESGTEPGDVRGFERGAPAAAPTTVPALLARRVAERPEAPAVETGRGPITYAELDARASAIAARLRPHVRGPDPVVLLLLDRGADFAAAMLAAWRAGCAFSPIDPRDPPARVAYLAGDLSACALVTGDSSRADAIGLGGLPIVDLGRPRDARDDAAPHEPAPDETAYVLYTSGTTGLPKGVAIHHRGLAQLVTWCVDECGTGPGDRVSQIASVGFDAAQLEIWPCLASGACLVPLEAKLVVPELAAWLDGRRVTRSFLVTPLAEALWSLPDQPSHLREMQIGGAALTRPPPALPYPVRNLYGPTESTVLATSHALRPDGPLNVVGRPIAGARVYVLDEDGDRCPVGVDGEIHLAGTGVASGYWRRPALTQQRFAELDPDGEPGPVYRTGDRGRWLPDGTLEFLGRADRQIELHGYRIEPGEIEGRLRADPLVAAAAVRADRAGPTARLVAYAVPRPGAGRDSAAVFDRLGGSLPEHLVPDALVWMDELPLNERGKLDEARLPRPTRADSRGGAAFAPPAGELEQRIAAAWCRVLGLDLVGSHDNFFDLGGSSLLLMNLRAELQAELGTALPIPSLFEHATVRALARSLAELQPPRAAPPDEPPAEPRDDARERAQRARQARAARRPSAT